MTDADAERKRRVQRMVASKVTDEMLTTPVGELSDAEAAIMQAVMQGEFADEIMARIDTLNTKRQADG